MQLKEDPLQESIVFASGNSQLHRHFFISISKKKSDLEILI
jgi:hypothetical protein